MIGAVVGGVVFLVLVGFGAVLLVYKWRIIVKQQEIQTRLAELEADSARRRIDLTRF